MPSDAIWCRTSSPPTSSTCRPYDPRVDAGSGRGFDPSVRSRSPRFTLISTHERRPNNWGTHAGASRAAIAAYLGDKGGARTRCDRCSAAGWVIGRPTRASSTASSTGRPTRASLCRWTRAGPRKRAQSIDGALPSEMRRGGAFRFPPKRTEYPWERAGGRRRAGRDPESPGLRRLEWSDERRCVAGSEFLAELDRKYGRWWAAEDDTWQPWLVNAAYGTSFDTDPTWKLGKNMDFTDWTHRRR